MLFLNKLLRVSNIYLKTIISFLGLIFVSNVVVAGHCVNDIKKITELSPYADPYYILEKDSLFRKAWVPLQNQKFLAEIKTSSNLKTISDVILTQVYKRPELQLPLNDEASLVLKSEGLGKTQNLVYKDKAGVEKTILSSHEQTKSGTLNFIGLSLSPTKEFAIVFASENGNIDDFRTFIVDVNKQTLVKEILTAWNFIAWKSPTEFVFNDSVAMMEAPKHETIQSIYNIKSLTKSVIKGEEYHSTNGVDDVYLVTDSTTTRIGTSTSESVILTNRYGGGVIKRLKNLVYFQNKSGNGRVDVIDLNSSRKTAVKTLIPENKNKILMSVTLLKKEKSLPGQPATPYETIVVRSYFGANQFVDFYSMDGKLLQSVDVPMGTYMNKVVWDEKAENLIFNLSSSVNDSMFFEYSTKYNKFVDPDLKNKMLTSNGISYASYVVEVKSNDGAMVPVLITHRKDIVKNSNNPTLIYGYGGFNAIGYIYPKFNAMNSVFLKDGGVLAMPALRGGAELGEKWHQQGMLDKKQNVFNDLIVTAKYMSDKNISRPEKIAVQGWSNGGLLAGATALQESGTFGLAIAGAGVEDMLRKEVLDARFDSGWSTEYGDSRKADVRLYLDKYSPVEQAKRGRNPVKLLIFNGRNDSRVNPAHSYKLYAALKDNASNPDDVHFMSVNNSGHWVTAPFYQDVIGWRAQTMIWTFIYDHMGMTARW